MSYVSRLPELNGRKFDSPFTKRVAENEIYEQRARESNAEKVSHAPPKATRQRQALAPQT